MELEILMGSLRKVLKLKGVSFVQLAQMLEISDRTLSDVFSGQGLSVERLLKICDHIGVTPLELF